MTTVFQSIPSPSPEWQQVPLGAWLDAIGVLPLVQGSVLGAVLFGVVLGLVITVVALLVRALTSRLSKRDAAWTLVGSVATGIVLAMFLRIVGPTWGIQTYALCILAGIVVATLLTGWRLRQRGVDAGYVIDIAVWAVLLGIIAARIFHVATHPDDYFGPGRDPMTALYIWEGGIAIFGALIGGALGVWLGCRQTGVRFTTFADALAPGLLLAQGRLDEAEAQEAHAAELAERALPDAHPLQGFIHEVHSTILSKQGRAVEALAAQERSLAVRLELHGEAHPLTIQARLFHGRRLVVLDRLAEAEETLLVGRAAIQDGGEASAVLVRVLHEDLVKLYVGMGDAEREALARADLERILELLGE